MERQRKERKGKEVRKEQGSLTIGSTVFGIKLYIWFMMLSQKQLDLVRSAR